MHPSVGSLRNWERAEGEWFDALSVFALTHSTKFDVLFDVVVDGGPPVGRSDPEVGSFCSIVASCFAVMAFVQNPLSDGLRGDQGLSWVFAIIQSNPNSFDFVEKEGFVFAIEPSPEEV